MGTVTTLMAVLTKVPRHLAISVKALLYLAVLTYVNHPVETVWTPGLISQYQDVMTETTYLETAVQLTALLNQDFTKS
jgi:hypothetical protein